MALNRLCLSHYIGSVANSEATKTDVNESDKDGETPLHFAFREDRWDPKDD